jgi:hypothetical protein
MQLTTDSKLQPYELGVLRLIPVASTSFTAMTGHNSGANMVDMVPDRLLNNAIVITSCDQVVIMVG